MENSLTHYGVLGMKWGIRRPNSSGISSSSNTKKMIRLPINIRPLTNPRIAPPPPKIIPRPAPGRSVQDMSDEELRKTLNRIQMEQQYEKLSTSDINRGKVAAQQIFKTATTVAAVTTTAITIYNNIDKIRTIAGTFISKR